MMEHQWRIRKYVLPFFPKGKDLEVRVKTSFSENVEPGDEIVFGRRLRRKVLAVREYPSFDEMFKKEDPRRIFPGMPTTETLELLREMYPPERECLGILVFELQDEAAESRK